MNIQTTNVYNANMLTPEQIAENYEEYVNLLKRVGDARQTQIESLLNHFEERLALCPGTNSLSYHHCYPGGLVQHSLEVLKLCNRQAQAANVKVDKQALIFSCLFHDLGKVGDPWQDYYVPQTNDFYRQKGNLYEYNSKIQFMEHEHRSLFNLQYFNVPMSSEEFLAILLHNGAVKPANQPYTFGQPTLALLVHQADMMSALLSKKETASE
jgi:23S rRNA maturation-related 3'-5' exoribonuclease YhaM